MSRPLVAIAIGWLVWAVPVAAAAQPGEPTLSHAQLDKLENHIGLIGLLGLLGLLGLRGRDSRR